MPTGNFQQYVSGFALMTGAILTGIVMSWIGGQIIDGFYGNQYMPDSVLHYAMYLKDGVTPNPVYDAMANNWNTLFFVNLFYALCFFIPLLGVALYWQSMVKYQSAQGYAMAFDTDRQRMRGRRRRG